MVLPPLYGILYYGYINIYSYRHSYGYSYSREENRELTNTAPALDEIIEEDAAKTAAIKKTGRFSIAAGMEHSHAIGTTSKQVKKKKAD